MINCIPLRNYLNYKTESSINILITDKHKNTDSSLIIDNGALPNSVALAIWDGSPKTQSDWDAFSKMYEYDLEHSYEGKRFIKVVDLLDASGKTVNIVCTCTNPDRCCRSIIAKKLIGIAEVHLE